MEKHKELIEIIHRIGHDMQIPFMIHRKIAWILTSTVKDIDPDAIIKIIRSKFSRKIDYYVDSVGDICLII